MVICLIIFFFLGANKDVFLLLDLLQSELIYLFILNIAF